MLHSEGDRPYDLLIALSYWWLCLPGAANIAQVYSGTDLNYASWPLMEAWEINDFEASGWVCYPAWGPCLKSPHYG